MRLKNISLLTIGAIAAALCVTSCEDFRADYLTQANPNEMNTDVFWEDLDDCQSGLTAVYNAFKNDDLFQTTTETKRTDLAFPGGSGNASSDVYYLQTFNSSESVIKNKWTALYKGVFYANQVIVALDALAEDADSSLDMDEWTSIMAQARFFRGLFYFYLTTSFNEGCVPIFDFVPATVDEFYLPCNTAENVLAFLRADMEYAEENLPTKGSSADWGDGDIGRPNSETASAVLGTSYLYDADYTTAATYFQKIINNSSYYLAGAGDNAFEDNEFNSESLLEVNYTFDYNYEYYYYDDESLATHLAYQVSHVGGSVAVNPANWLATLYTAEPVDHLNPENRMEMQRDVHGDLYYAYDPSIYQPTVTLGGTNHVIYPVMAKAIDVKEQLNGTLTADDCTWLDPRKGEISATNIPDEFERNDVVSNFWPDSVYVFLKMAEVDGSGNIKAASREDLTGVNEGYQILLKNTGLTPVRPWAGDRSLGAIKVYDEAKIGNAKGNQEFDYSLSGGTPYRYRQRSLRTYYSMWSNEDMDIGHYTYPFPIDHCKTSLHTGFKKYTNWQTRTSEDAITKADSEINLRLIRLADIYLMYAECLIKGGTDDGGLSEALKYVNRVRKRAGTVLAGRESGGEYIGSATYQDSNFPEYNVFEGDHWCLYNDKNIKNPTSTASTVATEADIIDTAAELMDHLMYYERPLELVLDGHGIRTCDMRRWGITKARLTDISTNKPYTTTGHSMWNSVKIYDSTNKVIDLSTSQQSWSWQFKYLPDDSDFLCYFQQYTEGSYCNTGAKYQFENGASNYNDSKAYYPIPNSEVTANPYINEIVDREDL
ncbi:MAG: RagB/SusD family nutrient uptake outer membrane protein [Rikenellaceae bacterium]